MRTASELLSPTVKPPPGLSPLLSAGHGPFSTRDGLFAHRLRLPLAGTACVGTRVRPGTQSRRDEVTEGLCARAGGRPPGAGTEHRELSPAGAGDILWRQRLLLPVFPA